MVFFIDLTEWQGPWGEQSSCVCIINSWFH